VGRVEHHANSESDLFSITDKPVIKALGLYREPSTPRRKRSSACSRRRCGCIGQSDAVIRRTECESFEKRMPEVSEA